MGTTDCIYHWGYLGLSESPARVLHHAGILYTGSPLGWAFLSNALVCIGKNVSIALECIGGKKLNHFYRKVQWTK